MRLGLFLLTFALAATCMLGAAHAGQSAPSRTRCAPIPGPAYKGSTKWKLGVDKITCAAGKLAAKPILPIAATTRKTKAVKNGSFSCFVYPGGAECKGKGGQDFGIASAAFGSN
jgi:hypothetical protein